MIKAVTTGDGTSFYTERGDKIPRTFTPETPRQGIETFHASLNAHEQEITEMVIEYEEKRAWNAASQGNGKNWPIFTKIEKFLNRLQKSAGVIDT